MLQNKLFINKIIKCMGKHNDISVRIQSFKLCRHLMKSREGFSMLINTHSDAIIKEIINAMSMFNSLNDPSKQMPLILEASRTAFVVISRTGSHHAKFLSKNIDIILLGIIFRKCGNNNNRQKLLYGVDKFAWDIFGYLGTYCEDNFEGQFRNLDNLISCACSWAANAMGQRHTITTESLDLDEPISRAILLLLLSPCNSLLCNSLQLHLKHYSNSPSRFILRFLSTLQSVTVPTRHTITDLTNFVCLCFLPKYQTLILKNQGMETLISFVKRRAESDILIARERIANHLDFIYEEASCCVDEDNVNDWEGSDLSLFYGLICLSKLLEISSCLPREDLSIFLSILNREQFGEGPKSYCRYILNLCSLHGFQSGLSEKISKGFGMREFSDVTLLFNKGESFDVHGAVLIARCPKLFPTNSEYPSRDNPKMVIKLSDRVDREALGKVLEYIYSGYIESDGFDDGLLRKIKLIAKNCGLVSLLEMVNKERPKWGSSGPHFDLKGALGPAGYSFSDVILEAKSDEQMECTHNSCQLSTPHIHAHKIILCLNCDYWRALFQSGMNESFSSTIKVPIGYSALTKLTNLFYSGNIPKVNLDCKFKSLTEEEKSREVKAYVELSFLAEYWCLEGIADDALRSVLDCIARNVVDERNCLRVIRFASELGQWRIVEGGIRELAPKYPKLRGMEWFEDVGDDLKEMLRVEYVKLM